MFIEPLTCGYSQDLTLEGCGDFLDLLPALEEQFRIDWFNLSAHDFYRKASLQGHCSALVKVLGDFSDLFMAHRFEHIILQSATSRKDGLEQENTEGSIKVDRSERVCGVR